MRQALRPTLCALFLAAFLLPGRSAYTQDQPLQLFPSDSDEPSIGTSEDPLSESGATPTPEEGAPSSRQGIEVDTLSGPDPAAMGVLGADQGGFPADIWRGSRRASVTSLLFRAQGGLASPVLRELLVRLLLTAAPAPARDGDAPERPPAGSRRS